MYVQISPLSSLEVLDYSYYCNMVCLQAIIIPEIHNSLSDRMYTTIRSGLKALEIQSHCEQETHQQGL